MPGSHCRVNMNLRSGRQELDDETRRTFTRTWVSIALAIWSYKKLSRVSVSDHEPRLSTRPRRPLTTLLNFQPDDPPRELAIDVESLVASDGMTPHNRVDMLHRLATHDSAVQTVPTIVGLFDTRVNRGKGTEEAFEGLRKLLEGLDLRDEDRITARFRC